MTLSKTGLDYQASGDYLECHSLDAIDGVVQGSYQLKGCCLYSSTGLVILEQIFGQVLPLGVNLLNELQDMRVVGSRRHCRQDLNWCLIGGNRTLYLQV